MVGGRAASGAKKTGFTAFARGRPSTRARPEQGREHANINILAVALALLRERRSYGLLSDLSTESLNLPEPPQS